MFLLDFIIVSALMLHRCRPCHCSRKSGFYGGVFLLVVEHSSISIHIEAIFIVDKGKLLKEPKRSFSFGVFCLRPRCVLLVKMLNRTHFFVMKRICHDSTILLN